MKKKECNHTWKHEIYKRRNLNKQLCLWLVHKCEKCGLENVGSLLKILESEPSKKKKKKEKFWTRYNKYWTISFGLWFAFIIGWIISAIKDSIIYMEVFSILMVVCVIACIIFLILDRRQMKGGKKRK